MKINILKAFFALLFTPILLNGLEPDHAESKHTRRIEADYDSYDMSSDFEDLSTEYNEDDMQRALCQDDFKPTITYCEALSLIMNTLYDEFNVDFVKVLGLNLYLRTNPILKRDINTLPIFTLYHNQKTDYCSYFNFALFFNQTTNQDYYKNCEQIKCYIGVNEPDLIDELAKLSSSPYVPLDIPDLLSLIKNARLEERRAGIMFQYLKNWNKSAFEFQIPIIYQERNFNFTESEIMAIRSSDLFSAGTPQMGDETPESVAMKYAVSDLFGVGDLNCKFSHQFINTPRNKLRAGFVLSIPTAFAFKKGLLGYDFSKECGRPPFNIYEYVDLFLSGEQEKIDCVISMAKEISLDAYKRMAANILQTNLGENKHFRLGLTLEPEIQVCHNGKINSLIIASYIMPRTEQRYFLRRKNCAEFDRNKYLTDVQACEDSPGGNSEKQARADLKFFSEQLVNTFFPDKICASVDPRFMLQCNIAATAEYKYWQFILGIDAWYRSQERVTPKENSSIYYTDIAITPMAAQGKIFGTLNRIMEKCKYDFELSLNADYTFASKNIGKDFSLSLAFKFNY